MTCFLLLLIGIMAETIKTKVLVVGGGPGGYVAAIRAGQLGLETTLIEADRLGGTCLIRGCIPSKAIIHVAGEYETMTLASAKARHGLSLKTAPAVDFAETVRWKETVVDKLNTGVTNLLKRAKVGVLAGWGTFSDAKTCTVKTKDGEFTVTAEHVILAAGSLPVELPFLPFGGPVISSTEALSLDSVPKKLLVVGAGYMGLENMAVDMDGRFVRIDDQCRTSMKNVWAIGDLVGEPMLEHKAAKQGDMVAEIIAGQKRRFDPASIPAVCFTEPEVVSAGLLPTDAAAKNQEIITGMFPFAANGRALSMGAGDDGGFVRILARKDDRRVLGIQAVGAHVSELSGEFSHALEMGAVLEDIAGTIHVHPTLSEAFHEASLRALGHAIHI